MFGRKPNTDNRRGEPSAPDPCYPLSWPASQRWNPHYHVPRNSYESAWVPSELENGNGTPGTIRHRDTARSGTYMNSRRDADTHAAQANRRSWTAAGDEEEDDGFSDLAHWLETLAELYMNDLDNRARWDPRWLNLTRRERFEGLESATVTVFDYLEDNSVQQSGPMSSKGKLAQSLQNRPEESKVRVLLVSDLSRFVMGVLGQLYSVEPDFWFEHLVNSGYAASDSGLKLKNAVWLNWAERETRLRHRALPGTGQRTEWNVPRRTKGRCWAHMHWGRLGLLNYLGRKGFYENEIHQSLKDGRWIVERDVLLDKRGLLMTKRRKELVDRARRKKEKKEKKKQKKNKKRGDPHTHDVTEPKPDGSFRRIKTSNVYRAYSTFEGTPKNPKAWTNRDLRVMAPEGASYWSGVDASSRKTILILVDPLRSMRNDSTGELTPSVTFMPRAMEIEAYTEEETWRTAGPDETYLDPPPPPLSAEALKQRKQEAKKRRLKEKGQRLKEKLEGMQDVGHADPDEGKLDDDTETTMTSDSEYDTEYETNLRAQYKEPRPYARDRDFARKYALSTHDLLCRYMSQVTTAELMEEGFVIPSILMRMAMDDMWQLLAEMRLNLDHLDGDFGAGIMRQLTEAYGNTVLQNINWMRSTMQELDEWLKHLAASSRILLHPAGITEELGELRVNLLELRGRTDSTATLLASSMTIAQSTLVIEQTSGINKLTELAFVFVPISFITAAFSMQVSELTSAPPRLWVWGVALTAIMLVTYLIRTMLRSPSFQLLAMSARATILNRYSSSKAVTAAKQFNTLSNRAIAKFLCVATLGIVYIIVMLVVASLVFIVVKYGIWIGSTATAIYFIVTRWPELAVVIPCFLCLPLALLGWRVTVFWSDELDALILGGIQGCFDWFERLIPAKDEVEDDDLAMEGVETYARQAIMLIT